MTRIRFEDLPSTNTPRNAENLNKLNNVVISPTEPTTGEEVWIDDINKKMYIKNDNGVYEELYNKDEQITYNVNIQGGGTYNIPTIKRYVDIYFTMTYLGGILIKYTIDTQKAIFGSGIASSHDSDTGLDCYISECKIEDNTLTHTKCGYFSIKTQEYVSKENNKDYYIYQLKTYD